MCWGARCCICLRGDDDIDDNDGHEGPRAPDGAPGISELGDLWGARSRGTGKAATTTGEEAAGGEVRGYGATAHGVEPAAKAGQQGPAGVQGGGSRDPEAEGTAAAATAAASSAAEADPAEREGLPRVEKRAAPEAASSPEDVGTSALPAAETCTLCAAPELRHGCAHTLELMTLLASGKIPRNDPIHKHYEKKGGFLTALAGKFGDKKTMYCHHLTARGGFATRDAEKAGLKFETAEDVWKFLGKDPCRGVYRVDRNTWKAVCGDIKEKGHFKTCHPETCLFLANNLQCPIPSWACHER